MKTETDKEQNILDVVFKEKTHKVAFDRKLKEKSLEYGYEYWEDPEFPGYGGYHYDGRWRQPAENLLKFFNIGNNQSVLDVCCGKGFLMYEMSRIDSTLDIKGVDISRYAIANAKEEVRDQIVEAGADDLPFENNAFDLVVSLNSLYMLPEDKCRAAIGEIERVGKNAFIQVNSYRTDQEKENLVKWDCTTSVVKSTEEWKAYFKDIGYTGYYYWTIFL